MSEIKRCPWCSLPNVEHVSQVYVCPKEERVGYAPPGWVSVVTDKDVVHVVDGGDKT